MVRHLTAVGNWLQTSPPREIIVRYHVPDGYLVKDVYADENFRGVSLIKYRQKDATKYGEPVKMIKAPTFSGGKSQNNNNNG
jgi:hypothetical protein